MHEFKKIYAVSCLAEIDRYTVEKESIKSIDLMNRAAGRFTEKLVEFFPGEVNFQIVAGPGNNGGDGFVCARLLREWGRQVEVYGVFPGEKRSPDCEESFQRYLKIGGKYTEVKRGEEMFFEHQNVVIVDALLGTGVNRPVTGLFADVIGVMNAAGHPIVALDMPSGLMGENNAGNDGAIVQAERTITFQSPKLAMMLPENYPYVGEWTVVDIGLNPEVLAETLSRYYLLDERGVSERLLKPKKFAHKGSQGHVLLVAGSEKMPGAAVLAARSAVRAGAGLVTVHVPGMVKNLLHLSVPEVLVSADRNPRCFTGCEVDGYQAVAVGPGIGKEAETGEGLKELLRKWQGKLVLDADALNLLAENPDTWEWIPENCILTPHPKEFERLAGKSENDFDRLNKLSIFARQRGVIVVLKGAHTVIASPDGRCYFNVTGNPGMAKGGAGDVLTGVIAGLLASGHSPLEAALVGVFVHGLAGDRVKERLSVRGMAVSDIVEELGGVWKLLDK